MRTPLDVITLRFRDQSEEYAPVRVPLKSAFTAPQLTALRMATYDMTTLAKSGYIQAVEVQDVYQPGAGQRESKYLVRGIDATNNFRVHLSIPGVRSGTVYLPDSDFVDMVNDPFAPALVTALNAIWASNIFDALVTVESIEVVRGLK